MMEKLREVLKKYRFAALVALAGIVLMVLPGGKKDGGSEESCAQDGGFSLEETEKRMAEVLGSVEGVGKVRVMLTLRSGETLSLAEDSSSALGSGGDVRQDSQVLTVNRGSGRQEVVVTNRVYPRYVGALVVCEGGGSAGVRLAVTQAVSALTALPSDKITVLQGKP